MTEPSDLQHSPRIPLIIGINGRRDLKEFGEALEEQLLAKLREIADAHPHSPLMFMTALAEGADWLAARAVAALARGRPGELGGVPRVTMVCPLPLARELYAEDFPDEHRARFDRLLDKREIELKSGDVVTFEPDQLITFALTPLIGADVSKMGRTGGPSGASGPHRTIHYEQNGVFVADHCHILISLMERDEKPDRVGGTARIVHYKCAGGLPESDAFNERMGALDADTRVDDALRGIPARNRPIHWLRAASHELTGGTEPSDWFAQRTGHVWQLTVEAEPKWRFLPASEGTEGAPHEKDRQVGGDAALLLFKAIELFNVRLVEADAQAAKEEAAKKAQSKRPPRHRLQESDIIAINYVRKAIPGPEDAPYRAHIAAIFATRRALSGLQRATQAEVTRSLATLATMFVLSVAGIAGYGATAGSNIVAANLFAVGALIAVAAAFYSYLHTRSKRVSAINQDYRAAAEALRVQLGWRLAGMRDRAERCYSPGNMAALERVREGVAMINAGIALRCRPQDITRPPPAMMDLARYAWTREQTKWFAERHGEKEKEARERITWAATCFGLGVGLFTAVVWYRLGAWFPYITMLAFLVLLPVPAFTYWRRLVGRPTTRIERYGRVIARVLAIAWSLAPLLLTTLIGVAVITLFETYLNQHMSNLLTWLAWTSAVLNGLAGAFAYRFEKSAAESEARNYAEMKVTFATAEKLLDACAIDKPPADALRLQHKILRELGRAALAENAYWLRAHRERPIEPIAGG